MFIIGLTGGLATGKSTVLNIFKNNGIAVVDADQIARDVVEPGQKAWKQIVDIFGKDVLFEDGTINRIKLGTLIFNDVEKRRKLNAVTHPPIQKALIKNAVLRFFEGHAFVVMELPLLFETGRMISMMHKIITVTCEDEQQIERLCNRNDFPRDIAKKRISSQMPLQEKISFSQFVINNSGTIDDTEKQTENIIRILKASKFHWYIRACILGAATLPLILYSIYHYYLGKS